MTHPRPDKLPTDVSQVMLYVLIALIPGIVIFCYQTGWGGLLNIALATLAALGFEAVALKLRGQHILNGLNDYTAVVTAVLIALCLPPLVPWWIPVIAAAMAILLAKHCYGGLGQNIFNPAMAGYAVVLISFPRELSLWPNLPDAFSISLNDTIRLIFNGGLAENTDWDAFTGATALDKTRDLLIQGTDATHIRDITHGVFGALHSEWLNLAFLCGGIYLIFKKVISWHIPLSIVGSVLCLAMVHTLISPNNPGTAAFHLFGGATMLCAFFIATDPVSAAASNRGRLIYGAGIGVFLYLIRNFGNFPDSVAFAVLLMNCATPMIDRLDPYLRAER